MIKEKNKSERLLINYELDTSTLNKSKIFTIQSNHKSNSFILNSKDEKQLYKKIEQTLNKSTLSLNKNDQLKQMNIKIKTNCNDDEPINENKYTSENITVIDANYEEDKTEEEKTIPRSPKIKFNIFQKLNVSKNKKKNEKIKYLSSSKILKNDLTKNNVIQNDNNESNNLNINNEDYKNKNIKENYEFDENNNLDQLYKKILIKKRTDLDILRRSRITIENKNRKSLNNSFKYANKNKKNYIYKKVNTSQMYFKNNRNGLLTYCKNKKCQNNNALKFKTFRGSCKIDSHLNSGILTSFASTQNQTKKDKTNIKINKDVTEFEYSDDLSENNSDICSLKKWLSTIDLSSYYLNFIDNNIYNVNTLKNELIINNSKINYEVLENILKIHIPGHIFRILCKIEIDSGLINKNVCNFLIGINSSNLVNNLSLLLKTDEDLNKCFSCCEIKQKIKTKNNLKTFLIRYNLLSLYDNFIHNGFDLINYVLLQMYTKYVINDKILENCFHIYNEHDRQLLLNALLNEIKEINIFLNSDKNKNQIIFPKYENIHFIRNKKAKDEYNITVHDENEQCNYCFIF